MAKHIQIRNVPDDVHARLRTHAAAAGLSLSEYLRREVTDLASRPPLQVLLDRVERRTGGAHLSGAEWAAGVRADRDSRH